MRIDNIGILLDCVLVGHFNAGEFIKFVPKMNLCGTAAFLELILMAVSVIMWSLLYRTVIAVSETWFCY